MQRKTRQKRQCLLRPSFGSNTSALLPYSVGPDAFWVVTLQVHEYPQVRITGDHLVDWLPYIYNIFVRQKYRVTNKNLDFQRSAYLFMGSSFIH